MMHRHPTSTHSSSYFFTKAFLKATSFSCLLVESADSSLFRSWRLQSSGLHGLSAQPPAPSSRHCCCSSIRCICSKSRTFKGIDHCKWTLPSPDSPSTFSAPSPCFRTSSDCQLTICTAVRAFRAPASSVRRGSFRASISLPASFA